MPTTDTDRAFEAFLALPEEDRRFVETIALSFAPPSSYDMQKLLEDQAVRDSALRAKKYGDTAIRKTVKELHGKGIMPDLGTSWRTRLELAEGLAHRILFHFRNTGGLKKRIKQLWPETDRRYYYDENAAMRHAVQRLYLGDSQALQEASKDTSYRRVELLKALGPHVPAEILGLLDDELRRRYSVEALHEAVLMGRSLGAGELRLCQAVAAAGGPCGPLLSDYFVLRGELVLARECCAQPISPSHVASQAFIALAEGDAAGARQLAQQAVNFLPGAKRRKTVSLQAYSAPFLTLALLHGDPEDAALAGRLVQSLAKRMGMTSSSTSFDVRDQLAEMLRPSSVSPSPHDIAGALQSMTDWRAILLFGLKAAWHADNKRYTESQWPILKRLQQHFERTGFAWAARECESVYTRLVRGSAEGGDGCLLRLRTEQAPWERALRALSVVAIGARAEQTGRATAEDRLIFVVHVNADGGLSVQARRQRALKTGGFSGGQDLSPGHLAKQAHKLTFISAADHKVLACVTMDRSYYGTIYDYSPEVASALVGHPCVFFKHNLNTPTEVIRGEPEMRLDKSKRGFSLRVHPRIVGRAVFCEAQGQRLLVYVTTPKQREIDALLQDGVDFPHAADEELRATVSQLTPLLQLQSAIEIASVAAEQVDADSRLALLLWRKPDGLRLRPVACPLGIDGPALVPGEGHAGLTARIEGVSRTCQRDLSAERAALTDLLAMCPALKRAPMEGQDYLIDGLSECLELLDQLRALEAKLIIRWPEGEPISVVGARDVRDLRLRLKTAAQWIAADAELEVADGEVLRMADLLQRLKTSRGRFLDLGQGRFLSLSDELSAHLNKLSTVVYPVKDGHHGLHPLTLGLLSGWVSDVTSVKADRAVKERFARFREAEQLEVQVPRTLQAELRDYQRDGVAWMQRLAHFGAGACLADDMGLGKTVQTLAVLLSRSQDGPALVVAPTSVCQTWIDEALRFAPTLRMLRVSGPGSDSVIEEAAAGDILVISYAVLVNRVEALKSKRFSTVVLDEAQAIKNAATHRARAAGELLADFRIATTGTPIENHLGELWSIMSFLNPGLLGTSRQFVERYGRPIQRDNDRAALAALRMLVAPFVLRRQKSAVLAELPALTEMVRYVEPDEQERIFYQALRLQALARVNELSDGEKAQGPGHIHVLAELTRLRRAACHPSLAGDETGIPSAKLEAVLETVDDLRAGNHRALIFSQFVGFLGIVKAALDERKILCQYLDGQSSEKQRAASVRAFQNGEGDVFLISLKAGGFGLNLTGADYVIHLDPWWNPAVERQASDRAHRMGQTRPVTVYRFVSRGSIEEQVLELHAGKRELADKMLEGSSQLTTLDLSTLRALLAGESIAVMA